MQKEGRTALQLQLSTPNAGFIYMTCFQAEPILSAGKGEPSNLLGMGQWDLQSLCKVPVFCLVLSQTAANTKTTQFGSRFAHCCSLSACLTA